MLASLDVGQGTGAPPPLYSPLDTDSQQHGGHRPVEIKDRTAKATSSDIADILGPMSDTRRTAIIAVGATIEQLEEAAAWAAGESDVMGQLRRPVSGPVAAVYDIITAVEEQYGEED